MKNLKDEIERIVVHNYKPELLANRGGSRWLPDKTLGKVEAERHEDLSAITQMVYELSALITSLIEQEKERAVMGFIKYMYGQNLPLHKAGVVTVRAFAKQYLAERKGY